MGGGNTKSMLAVWREWQLPKLLRAAWNRGTVLAGISAGAICWFEMGVTDSWAGRLAALRCLGWLPGACCPHYDGEVERRPATREMVARGVLPETLALEDGAAAHFIGSKLLRIVTARPKAGALSSAARGATVRGDAAASEIPGQAVRTAARKGVRIEGNPHLKTEGCGTQRGRRNPGPLTRIVSAPWATRRTPKRKDEAWAPATKHQEGFFDCASRQKSQSRFLEEQFGTLRSE